MAEYSTFAEAFQEFQLRCKRNAAQGLINCLDPSLEKRYRRCAERIINRLKEVSSIGAFPFCFKEYNWYHNRAAFNVEMSPARNRMNWCSTQEVELNIWESTAFFEKVISALISIEAYQMPNTNSRTTLEELRGIGQRISDIETDIGAAQTAMDKIKKELALDFFILSKGQGRVAQRRTAWGNRTANMRQLTYTMKNLWETEHPLQEGSECEYTYTYNGTIHGQPKKGVIIGVNGGSYKIKTDGGRIVARGARDIYRRGNSRYENSAEYETVTKYERGEFEELAG